MKKPVELRLPSLPPAVTASLPDVIPLRVRVGGDRAELRTDVGSLEVAPLSPPQAAGPDAEELLRRARAVGPGTIPLVVGRYLRRDLRLALQRADVSYVDEHGNLFLSAPGVHLFIDGGPGRTRSVRVPGVGVVGVRAIQILLGDHSAAWTVTGLAQAAGMSVGQAANVFRSLQAQDLVFATGRGPGKRRHVRDAPHLLDWLAGLTPAGAVGARLPCTLYGRTPEEVARSASQALAAADIGHAVTGGAAAEMFEAGPTSVPQVIVRVEPRLPLHEAARAMDIEPNDRGSNLLLTADTGRVGVTGAEEVRGVMVAPKVRIYLDLLHDRRGEDAAAAFRELVLGF